MRISTPSIRRLRNEPGRFSLRPHARNLKGYIVKKTRLIQAAALLGVAAISLSACASNESGSSSSTSSLSGQISGSGASSQSGAQEAWKAGFIASNASVAVNYDPEGSGAGRKAFAGGTADFAGSDSAVSTDELAGKFAACKTNDIVEIPAYISPIAVAFKLDGIDSLNMDAATIAKVFSGQISKWNDPAIADLNSGVTLPDTTIKVKFRGDESGTTKNFLNYLKSEAPDAFGSAEVGETFPFASNPNAQSAQKTQGVKQALSGSDGSIGYLDASQAGDLGTVAVNGVKYSAEAAVKIVEHSKLIDGRGDADLAYKLDYSVEGAYPIVLVSYLIGCQEYQTEGKGELVKAYFEYVISADGQKQAADHAGSAPLSDAVTEKAKTAVNAIK